MTFDIPPGAIVGIIGPNGAGKTTLFRMIVGQEQPDDGALTVGQTVKLAYVDQSRDARRREDGLAGDQRRRGDAGAGQAQGELAGLRVALQLRRAPTSRSSSARSPAASATGCIWPRC
jgi:ATPase subunit of ABC transporter with duplicated ATPase domains